MKKSSLHFTSCSSCFGALKRSGSNGVWTRKHSLGSCAFDQRIGSLQKTPLREGVNLEEQPSGDKVDKVSTVQEIKAAVEQLSFEQRPELAAWLHGWKDDEWDQQMKHDIAGGKLDNVLREVDGDIRAGRLRDMP
jgi:hypothetical protein